MFSSGPMTPGGGISGAGSPWDERPTKVGVSGRSPGSIASEFSPAKESVLGTPQVSDTLRPVCSRTRHAYARPTFGYQY